MKKTLLFLIQLFVFTGCDMLRFHPYQELDCNDTHLTQQNISLIEHLGHGRDTLRFAFISDVQRSYDEVSDFSSYINRRADIDFVLVGGDLTDFGLTDEFRWITDYLSQIHKPWLTVIGNHDFLGLGENNYQKVFGPYDYSLNIGHTHLVCLNTIWRDSERGIKAPNFEFLREDIISVYALNALRRDSITHTVVMMHNMPGDEQFDNTITDRFITTLNSYPGLRATDVTFTADDVQKLAKAVSVSGTVEANELEHILGSPLNGFCIKGHTHTHALTPLGENKMLFYCVNNIHKHEMLLFTLYPQGYAFECIHF